MKTNNTEILPFLGANELLSTALPAIGSVITLILFNVVPSMRMGRRLGIKLVYSDAQSK
jgi:hypothetical protein